MKKMTAFGGPKTPEQAQRMLNLLTPAERRAYMTAVGEEDEMPVRPGGSGGGWSTAARACRPRRSPLSTRPGSSGRKTGKSAKKKR